MPISLTCPHCSGKLRVADNLAGKKIKCPKCSAVFPAGPAEGPAAITKKSPSTAAPQGIQSTLPPVEELEEVEDLEEVEELEEAPRVRGRRIRRDPAGEAISTIIPYKNARALTAYYLGVFSLIPSTVSCVVLFTVLLWRYYLSVFSLIPGAGLLLGPAALVLGILGLRYVRANPTAKGTGHAVAGIILGGLSTVGNLGVLISLFVLGKPA